MALRKCLAPDDILKGMIYEVGKGRIKDGDKDRRWFTCDYFDIYFWSNQEGSVDKFQICLKPQYSISTYLEMKEKVVTWDTNKGIRFHTIEPTNRYSTPLLEPVSPFDLGELSSKFFELSQNIDIELKHLIEEKLFRMTIRKRID